MTNEFSTSKKLSIRKPAYLYILICSWESVIFIKFNDRVSLNLKPAIIHHPPIFYGIFESNIYNLINSNKSHILIRHYLQ